MPLTTGQILNNRYRIARLLGQGGFGAVYKAWDTTLNRPCAVKESFEQDTEAGRQFLREAQILANLSHPNLPRVTDYFALPGAGQYLVMDFVEGQDLEQLLAQAGGRLPESQALPWIGQVCDALAYLHRQQPAVIHRDIKPANIKITPPDQDYPHGRAMLVDFGVAKVYDPSLRTTQGARAVTPGYSPHEQYGQTGAATDARTDIYALGATLYTLLTGQAPPESILRMVTDPLLPPRQLNPAISPAVETAILQALQVDPSHRFQSAAEFKRVITEQLASSGKPVLEVTQVLPVTQANAATPDPSPLSPASPDTLGKPLPPAVKPFPWKWVGLGAGLLVLVGVLAVLAVIAGLVFNRAQQTRLTQTALANSTQTAAAVAAALTAAPTLTPSPTITATMTETPTPTITPSPTSTPSPTITLTPTSTPLGGGSGLIAFVSDRDDNLEIYLINADGSGLTNLTNNAAADSSPSWSPDGRQIAFNSTRDRSWEIYLMNADGSGLSRLTDNSAYDYAPVWSPDGRQIAFLSDRDGNWEIYLMNADGSGQTNLTDNPARDWSPSWAP